MQRRNNNPFKVGIFCLFVIGLNFKDGYALLAQESNKSQAKSTAIVVRSKPYLPAPKTKLSQAGKTLFIQNNCVTCHSVGSQGGCLGPPLLGVGARRSKNFILARITEGSEAENKFRTIYKATELMPHPRLSEQKARAIADYLLTLRQPSSGFIMSKHSNGLIKSDLKVNNSEESSEVMASSVNAGKKLFFEKGCAACHSAGGVGGEFAPMLDGISMRRDRQYIIDLVNGAQNLSLGAAGEYNARGTMMPPLNLDSDEVNQITDFLMTLPKK